MLDFRLEKIDKKQTKLAVQTPEEKEDEEVEDDYKVTQLPGSKEAKELLQKITDVRDRMRYINTEAFRMNRQLNGLAEKSEYLKASVKNGGHWLAHGGLKYGAGAAGGASGAMIGSAIPVVGTIAGLVVGFLLGKVLQGGYDIIMERLRQNDPIYPRTSPLSEKNIKNVRRNFLVNKIAPLIPAKLSSKTKGLPFLKRIEKKESGVKNAAATSVGFAAKYAAELVSGLNLPGIDVAETAKYLSDIKHGKHLSEDKVGKITEIKQRTTKYIEADYELAQQCFEKLGKEKTIGTNLVDKATKFLHIFSEGEILKAQLNRLREDSIKLLNANEIVARNLVKILEDEMEEDFDHEASIARERGMARAAFTGGAAGEEISYIDEDN